MDIQTKVEPVLELRPAGWPCIGLLKRVEVDAEKCRETLVLAQQSIECSRVLLSAYYAKCEAEATMVCLLCDYEGTGADMLHLSFIARSKDCPEKAIVPSSLNKFGICTCCFNVYQGRRDWVLHVLNRKLRAFDHSVHVVH